MEPMSQVDNERRIRSLEMEVDFLKERLKLEKKIAAGTLEWANNVWVQITGILDELTALRLQCIKQGLDWQIVEENSDDA